ncbi:MAG: hypothetical protein KAJ17_01365 [Candidatus Krumholzibacteria bacterium]|nr:hypothetical protein [Candidatus Krumholzibacteria bacterium]
MSRNKVTPKAFALLACSTLLVASIGCSPGSPTAPSSAPLNVVESPNFIRILSTSSKGVQEMSLTADVASKMISARDGGVISNGRVTLEFPPHALDKDTQITIEMESDGTLGVELGPHGIQFNRPVTMRMDLKGTTAEDQGETSVTLWFNEDEGWWERMPKVESENFNSVSASLRHFSRYNAGLNG